jgi:hypothetical protein
VRITLRIPKKSCPRAAFFLPKIIIIGLRSNENAPKHIVDFSFTKRGGHMAVNNQEANKWKLEQLEYFKKYLGTFNINSKEYGLIVKGIQDLEKSL